MSDEKWTGGPAPDPAAGPGREVPGAGQVPIGAGAPAPDAPEWASDLTPKPRGRLNSVTGVLLALVLVAGGFAGGIAVQRSHQPTVSTSGRGFGAGFAGGLPGGGASGQATPGSGRGFGGAGFGGTPAVSGTVTAVGDGTITVKSSDGKTVTVKVSATTTVSERGSTSLQSGAEVQVMGTTASDGSVDATAVVTRRNA